MPAPSAPTAASLRHHAFTKAIAHALRHPCALPCTPGDRPGPRLLVTVSGGADSVALLRALAALAPARSWRLRLTVAHVHHHLRQDADEDAAFVRDLAARLDLPASERHVTPADYSGNLEDNARQLRYQALGEMAAEVEASGIVTAHHADDQLETLLMRLIRGTSVRGMGGMAWRRAMDATGEPATAPLLLRPMLAVTRAEVIAFLQAARQPWREDATNEDATRWRARLRRDVVPVLQSLRADASRKAVAHADHVRELTQLLDEQADEAERAATLIEYHEGERRLDRQAARQTNPAVLATLLRKLHGANREAIDRDDANREETRDQMGRRTLESIIRAIQDDDGRVRWFDLPGSQRIRITRDVVTWMDHAGCETSA